MSIRLPLVVLCCAASLVSTVALAQNSPSGEADALVLEPAPVLPVDHSQPWEQVWKLEISRGGSAPLVWADSLLLVASLDRNIHLVAVSPEPRVRFKENFRGGFSAAPVVTARRIYLPELETGGRLIALDRATGKAAWEADAGDLGASPIIEAGRIFTVSTLGELKAWSEEGLELWATELETRVTARPALLGDILLVASTEGLLHAVDAGTGTVVDTANPDAGPIWGDPVVVQGTGGEATAVFATLGGQLLELGPDLAVVRQRSFPSRFFAGPTRAGERLYMSGHEGTIWSYDWMGDAIDWRLDLEDSTVRMAPAVGDDYVAVGDLDGTVFVIDRGRGDTLWSTRLDGALTSTPLFRGDEFYVMTEGGSLYAFRPIAP
ncbi:MAG TPA: PQQ-binding-like beta-propeller repeat protein [Gemmatimonadota bacterium]|nr:PQQ-binding-like beta-propeller repeat protein [Gemmatimonadota bacterium]